jgi:hypothetical protein
LRLQCVIRQCEGELHDWWDATADPYERLDAIAKHIVDENPEATFYDLFNFIREDVFMGWKYDDDSDFIRSIDFDIDYEARRDNR